MTEYVLIVNGYRQGQEAWPIGIAAAKALKWRLDNPKDRVEIYPLIEYLQTREERC